MDQLVSQNGSCTATDESMGHSATIKSPANPQTPDPATPGPITSVTSATSSSDSEILCFCPIVCTVDFAVWKSVSSAKLQAWRLDTPTLHVTGKLLPPQPPPRGDNKQRRLSRVGWRLHVDSEMFWESSSSGPSQEEQQIERGSDTSRVPHANNELIVNGLFFNANTVEDFKSIDRKQLVGGLMQTVIDLLIASANALHDVASLEHPTFQCLMDNLLSSPVPSLLKCTSSRDNILSRLSEFYLLSFADLKSHLYYYNVAAPALRPTVDFTVVSSSSNVTVSSSVIRAVGNALLNYPPPVNVSGTQGFVFGYFGCCALIRRVPLADPSTTPDLSEDWTEMLLDAAIDRSSPYHHFTRSINESACLIPLWVLIVFYKHYQSQQPVSRRHLLAYRSTEVIIASIDTASELPRTLGWPLRSFLFCLGYLGLATGPLPLLLYRDGVQELRDEELCTAPGEDQEMLSSVVTVLMPSKNQFLLPSCERIKMGQEKELLGQNMNMEQNEMGQPSDSGPAATVAPVSRDPLIKGWLKRSLKEGGNRYESVTFLVDLRRHLDPVAAQSDAVNLNVKLIQWRLLPQFDSEKLSRLRFLLVGVGTLGCSIARCLVGWGVTKLTLIDNANVALSSPVRQCLYTHSDAMQSRLKVHAARQRLLDIRPDLSINAISLELPMPGYPRFLATPDSEKMLQNSVEYLERVIDAHDVIYLLTDSRESRWLPSLIAASRYCRHNSNSGLSGPPVLSKATSPLRNGETVREREGTYSPVETVCVAPDTTEDSWISLFSSPPVYPAPVTVTVALGFDSFVVMRHGHRQKRTEDAPQEIGEENPSDATAPLACYFCNDLSAPVDSVAHRPLDQQCTVTRPGISFLAASIASELVAAISQHPAAPDPPHSSVDHGPATVHQSCLGAVPHTVRGTLGGFCLSSMRTEAFKHCICCSNAVCDAYCSPETKLQFLKDAVARSQSLEEVSGLARVKRCYRVAEVLNFHEFDEI